MEKLKILIVDDESGIRSGVVRILQNYTVDFPFMPSPAKFELFEAETGEAALTILDEKAIDIVLLDNKLPGIQGMEVLEHIRKKQFDILVIVITSHASLDMAVKATQTGAYDFVPKPFTPVELRASIENATKHLYLRRMTKKMTEAGKQIRFQFLSVLSHELKAPLNAIEGFLKMMEEKQLGDNIEDYMHIIYRTVRRVKGMRHLIMDLLDFTKIEFGTKKRKLEKINLTEIANVSIDTLNPFAIQKDISIKLNTTNPIYMTGDANEIEIIFNNLISNAIKYNVDKGKVDIFIGREQELISIKVTDTGIGMTEDDLSKVFNEFVRIKNQKTKDISGSGLGLTILKKITDLYDGDINVMSKPEKGSTFIVTLQNYNQNTHHEHDTE